MKRIERKWMYERLDERKRPKLEFAKGVREFIKYAEESDVYKTLGEMRCPCSKCNNGSFLTKRVVETHLYTKGFCNNYYVWTYHGEETSAEVRDTTAVSDNPDEYAASAKGYDKKSRLFGQGDEVARRWYKPSCNKSQRRSFSYQPTEVTQLSQHVQTLKTSQEQMIREQEQWRLQQEQWRLQQEQWRLQQEQWRLQQEQWRLQQEQFAAMQAAWAQMQSSQSPGSCSGIHPQRRDDFTNDGHGFGGSVESLG